jgi:heme iron utilization protein
VRTSRFKDLALPRYVLDNLTPKTTTPRQDPLADAATAILEHMNSDHKDALILLARVFAGIASEDATMTSVGRLGLQVRLRTEDGMRGVRIPFSREVSDSGESRQILVKMVRQARQR